MIVEKKNTSKQNKVGQITIINNYIFERVENFKYTGFVLNSDNILYLIQIKFCT
jgi:hypothetical protein